MKKSPFYILIALLIGAFCACNDDSTIGSSITQDSVAIVVDSSFTITGHSQTNSAIQSRTIAQLIGRIDAKGYGKLTSDVVTQFMPSASIDTDGITSADIDSLVLVLSVSAGEFVGDSIVPMGLDIYPLTRQLPSPIYSDFDPQGYYDSDNLLAGKMYNMVMASADSVANAAYRQIRIRMPHSLALKLYNEYVTNPATFSSPSAFAQFFPGIYMRNSYGSGRVSRVSSTVMSMYYHKSYVNDAGRDTTVHRVGNYFAVTPEIITNNNIRLDISPEIDALVDDGNTIVVAPAGLDVEARFPLPEIIARYRNSGSDISVINTLTFRVPGYTIENQWGITVPPSMLMVLKSKRDEFFRTNSLPDNKTSFLASYNSATQTYDFGEMRQYLLDAIEKGDITPDDYTFIFTPVNTIYETNQSSYYDTSKTLVNIVPYVASPVMGRLDFDKARIVFTYSMQTLEY